VNRLAFGEVAETSPRNDSAKTPVWKWVAGAGRRVFLTVPVLPITVLVYIGLAVVTPGFASWPNVQNLLGSLAVLAIAAIGATMVFLVAGIDLSVGSTVALSSVLAAIVTKSTESILLGLATALVVGMVVGAINGVAIGYGKLQPFVLTLGVLLVARAVAYISAAAAAGGGGTAASVGQLPGEVLDFGRSSLFGLPTVFLIAVVLVGIFAVILTKTSFGRNVYLLGSNERAAQFVGIRGGLLRLRVYGIAGTLGGVAGFILMTRLGSGTATAGDTLLLQVIAAAVIGGTSLFGGFGGVWRTLVGVFLIAGLANALGLLGMPSWTQGIVIGFVVVLGSGLAVYLHARSGRK